MSAQPALYCNSLTSYSRYQTRAVKVGNVVIGGGNPIVVQSMTTTDTMDTLKTVEQSIRMIEAGCQLVRITAPSIKEAENLLNIKNELRKRGYTTPLVADIHFTPNAAEVAARIVEKVRVNPGNYADRKKFETIEYNDLSYEAELERIRERFTPLVKICKEHGTAMRIGTNHGSLSDRIMSRYGDTPLGMVESALEFVRICRENDFHEIVLSMKASNTLVMVQAYRLLIKKMQEEGMNYPLHLGVTEAGEGEDGRIKSAVGIGTLLEDGIGDTIRVSLTEDPEFEIPVAKALVERYTHRAGRESFIPPLGGGGVNPYEHNRRNTNEIVNIGGHKVPVVIASLANKQQITPSNFFSLGYNYSATLDKWNISDQACDYIYTGTTPVNFKTPGTLGIIYDYNVWKTLSAPLSLGEGPGVRLPLFTNEEYLSAEEKSAVLNFISVNLAQLTPSFIEKIKTDTTAVLIITTANEHGMAEQRRMFAELMNNSCQTPVIIRRTYQGLDENRFQLHASTDAGALLIDGLGDGIMLEAEDIASKTINTTAFGILQAARTRISKTEYISCPSCGRTLFDLQETTAKIRNRTSHLKGIKIGIMGCIVNGPGEMADADYGYVGTGVGKITLYKGKEVVKRNVASENALDELIDLIRQHGDWIEAEPVGQE
ncbi:MAG: 4-hydroxy-3-methylbut-2-en-1-yl diphosphate synthase (ferredoxin) [Bacteroidia bacterium]|nr:4-hydroxy-3-methylbut-2-en-1-yl diphosphate synthase (ferredoxin) [Bacteroidia bacterium]